jgi:hypothetical protein
VEKLLRAVRTVDSVDPIDVDKIEAMEDMPDLLATRPACVVTDRFEIALVMLACDSS